MTPVGSAAVGMGGACGSGDGCARSYMSTRIVCGLTMPVGVGVCVPGCRGSDHWREDERRGDRDRDRDYRRDYRRDDRRRSRSPRARDRDSRGDRYNPTPLSES